MQLSPRKPPIVKNNPPNRDPNQKNSLHGETKVLKRKLRDSCDNCAALKVKCSKQRPTCKRCDDRGLSCQFSYSRRCGKQSQVQTASRTPIGQTPATEPTTPPLVENHQESTRDLFLDAKSLLFEQQPLCHNGIMLWEDPLPDFDTPTCQTENSMTELFKSPETSPLYQHDTIGNNFAGPISWEDISLPGDFSASTLAPSSLTSISPSLSPKQTFNSYADIKESHAQDSHDCMAMILNMLQALHEENRTCARLSSSSLRNDSPSLPLDLGLIKSAIGLMERALYCNCSLENEFWLASTLLCSKLIDRYDALKRCYGESMAIDMTREFAGRMDEETRAPEQVVLGELKRIQDLVERIGQRIQGPGESFQGTLARI